MITTQTAQHAELLGVEPEAVAEKLKALRNGWLKRIKEARAKREEWEKTAKDIYEIYDLEKTESQGEFNVLWSNVQILHSALYSATAQPDVRRRESAGIELKPLAVQTERAIATINDTTEFDDNINMVVQDYLVASEGIPWLRYDATVQSLPDGSKQITAQTIHVEHCSLFDFVHEPVKKWRQVGWVARRHKLTKAEIKEQFNVSLDHAKDSTDPTSEPKRFDVWELWDKGQRMVLSLCSEYQEGPLEVKRDVLGLKDFFPCPKPILTNQRSEKFQGKPDYCYYEKQAKQLDALVTRAKILVKSIKGGGFYDAALGEEFQQSDAAGDTEWVAVVNLKDRMRMEDGQYPNFANMVAEWPIKQKIEALQVIRTEIEENKQQMYEMLGISDIVRGASKASETATAQEIKGQWANLRLVKKQNAVNNMIKAVFRLMAEIVREHFTAEILVKMTGVELPPEIMDLGTDDTLRSFAIDVETDSTIARDDAEEKQNRIEMADTMMSIFERVAAGTQSGAMTADFGKAVLRTAVKGFKHGRNLEEAIEQLPDHQQQLMEIQQQTEQLAAERDQLAAELEQAQAMLAQVNERAEQREDIKSQSEAAERMGEADREHAQAEKLRSETVVPLGVGPMMEL